VLLGSSRDSSSSCFPWDRLPGRNIAPTPLRYPDLGGNGLLREPREIRDIICEIVALVFNWLIRFERSTLVLVKPIHLLADPDQLLGLDPQTPKKADRIRPSSVSVVIGGFGFGMAMVQLDVFVQLDHGKRSIHVATVPIQSKRFAGVEIDPRQSFGW
jgi:hypothetical protein